MRNRFAAVSLVALVLAAFAGSARGETTLTPLEPPPAEAASAPSLAGLRSAVASEARHLGAELRDTIAQAVARASREQGIPAFLLVALIAQESGFNPAAENAGALGLMQVRPFVAKDYAQRRGIAWRGEASLRDPAQNVQLASGYLGELFDRFESVDLALAAYNKGPEAVRRDLRNDRQPRQDFVDSVLRRYERYRERFGGGI